MIVVSSTTPLIGPASIQRFGLLEQLFAEIQIPRAVYDEAMAAGHEAGSAGREVASANWVRIVLKAKQVGLLSAIRPDMEGLRHQGFSLSQMVFDAVLKQAGE